MHSNLFLGRVLFKTRRRPYFDLIARCRQAVCDRAGVVRYSAALRRIFAGNDVPFEAGSSVLHSATALTAILNRLIRSARSSRSNTSSQLSVR